MRVEDIDIGIAEENEMEENTIMSEINSVKAIVDDYMMQVENFNTALAGDSAILYDDNITTLAVNSNSTQVEETAKQAVVALSEHITTDKGRIITMAELFEEKDQELAGEAQK